MKRIYRSQIRGSLNTPLTSPNPTARTTAGSGECAAWCEAVKDTDLYPDAGRKTRSPITTRTRGPHDPSRRGTPRTWSSCAWDPAPHARNSVGQALILFDYRCANSNPFAARHGTLIRKSLSCVRCPCPSVFSPFVAARSQRVLRRGIPSQRCEHRLRRSFKEQEPRDKNLKVALCRYSDLNACSFGAETAIAESVR